MRRLTRLLSRWGNEKGQALILYAAGLAAFCGLVGMAVDVGQIVYTRTNMQKVADAAAMAGAQDLPSSSAATASANTYVTANGDSDTSATISVSQTYSNNDTITVTATKHVEYTFLKVIGMSGREVSATAKARAGTYSGGTGLLPWGFVASNNSNSKLLQNPCYLGNNPQGVPQFQQNVECTVKYGAGTNSGGDFGALTLGNSGANSYRDNITNGSSQTYGVGDEIDSATGNMQGPTNQGISARFSRPAPSTCPGNSKSDVLKVNDDGSVSIRPGCESSPRIGIIPVVDKIDNPQKSTILGFAFVYLVGTSGGGGSTQAKVEFVKFVTAIPGGDYQGINGGATMVMLVD